MNSRKTTMTCGDRSKKKFPAEGRETIFFSPGTCLHGFYLEARRLCRRLKENLEHLRVGEDLDEDSHECLNSICLGSHPFRAISCISRPFLQTILPLPIFLQTMWNQGNHRL